MRDVQAECLSVLKQIEDLLLGLNFLDSLHDLEFVNYLYTITISPKAFGLIPNLFLRSLPPLTPFLIIPPAPGFAFKCQIHFLALLHLQFWLGWDSKGGGLGTFGVKYLERDVLKGFFGGGGRRVLRDRSARRGFIND